jgi:PhoPQ-activated pathogenicity-related protein
VVLQVFIVAEHLQTLLLASQYDPVVIPTQVEAVPHIQVPELQVSPELLHASPVPHLHTPLVQVSDVPLQELTVDEHLHTLLLASQKDPVVIPTQVDAVPHKQDPELQVSPELLHESAVPHLQTPLVQVSDVPLQETTVAEHLHTLFVASQYDPVVSPEQLEAVPHLQLPELQVSPDMLHVSPVPHLQTPLVQVSDVPLQAGTVEEHLHTLFVASQ